MDGGTSARSPIIANPTPYVRPTFYPERGRTVAGVAPTIDASAACYRYLQSPAMPHNTGCTYPHMGSIYPNAIPAPSTSPFRVPASGMSNLRQFWPPTPPPDGFGRIGMSTSLYPMYPAIAPLAPSSDSGIHGLIPRLGSSPSHYPHFFDTHKESSFLSPGLNIASPLTPTSNLASSTPLPPSFDRPQPFPPMPLTLKNMDLCKQQYCHENDETQRVETYADSACHHPISDQQRPGSANIEAHSKYEKTKGNSTYNSYQESHSHNGKSKNDSKLLKNNDKIEKKHCSRSAEDCSMIASNSFKSPDFQENLLDTNACKIKKNKIPQCSEYIDIVNISDTPRSYEEVSKSQTSDAYSEKLKHGNCCLYPTSTTAIVTSTPLTTSTSVTYSHQQFNTSGRIYSPVSDLQLKREIEENRHDCQFAKSTYGKTWHDRPVMELCHCQSENGHKSHHTIHTGACKVPKIPKTEPSQSSCCAQRLGNHQECLPLIYQPAMYESNNHSSQINSKCVHSSLPQHDIEQLSPTWNFLHNSPNHAQLDTISKASSIPELSGSNKEYKLPYASEFLPDIQPLNYASSKSQFQDSKTIVQNSSHNDKVRTISTSSTDTHCPSTLEKKTVTATTLSSVIVCSTANSNIPVGIAIAQQRHSMSSAWKLGKLTDPHFPAAHNGSEGFPSLPNTSACHKNDNILRDQSYLSIKSIPTLPSNHSGLLVSQAKQWEPDAVPRTVLPHTWLRHGRVVTPGMWIGQGSYAHATPTASLPIGPLDSAQVSMPPVGYQLARDSLTGHILLIPAVNIELIDGTQLWPKMDTSGASRRQSTSQMQRPRFFPIPPEDACQEIEVETSLFGTQETDRQEDKLQHQEEANNIKDFITENQCNKKKSIITDAKDDEVRVVESSPLIRAEIPVTSSVLENSSLFAEKHQSTSLQDYEHYPTMTLAQAPVAVQTEHAKRSQATSPLISVPITHHQSNKQKINHENIINDKENQNSVSVIPHNAHDSSNHHKTSAVQVNLEKESSAYNTEQEKCKSVYSSKDVTTEKCLQEKETIEQKTLPSVKIVPVDKKETIKRKEPTFATSKQCHSVANFIDRRGLNLLVNSIEELNCENLNNKIPNLTEDSKSAEKDISLVTNDAQRSHIIKNKLCKTKEPEYSFFSSLNTSSTDSLGILCALAEQRIIEETKSASLDLKFIAQSNLRDPYNSSLKVDERESSKEQTNKAILVPPVDNSKHCTFSECSNIEMSSEIESKEAEMRRRLAELQQKYKQKQKELARLQPRKSKKNISSRRCAGRPRTVRSYMYYRIRKDKLVSKYSSSNLIISSSDGHNAERKRKKSSINRNCVATKQGKKHKLEDLHRTNHKRSKELNTQLIDNSSFSRNYKKYNKQIDTKSSNSSKKRIKTNLYSNMMNCKEIAQEKQCMIDDAKQMIICEYPQTNYIQSNFCTPGLQICNNSVTADTINKKKDSINNELFPKTFSEVNLCIEHGEKHIDTEKPDSEQNLGIKRDSNENSAGYEGDTSDMEISPAKKRKTGKPKKYAIPTYKESSVAIASNQSRTTSLTKVDDRYIANVQKGTETKNLKLLHCAVKQSEVLSKAKKKMKFKKSLELSPKKIKNREHRKREKEEDISMTDELFAALKKCRLSETNVVGTPVASNGKEQLESSYSEGENMPLIALIDKSAIEVKSCSLSLKDLHDKTRVLIMEEGLFYAGFITAIQAPDVYGITLDGERGNKPHIYSREEILTAGILEVKPTGLRELPEGRRICAFWSQQYRCLYPGTVGKATNYDTVLGKASVFVEFDDGDSGSICIDDIRFLPQNYADSVWDPNSQFGTKQMNSFEAEHASALVTSIKNSANVGILGETNKITCSDKALENTAGENCAEEKIEIFPLQNCSEENETIDIPLTSTALPNKKKHSIKGNNSKKLRKSLNEIRHSSSKKDCKRKRTDKYSENLSSKLRRHRKHKDDHKRNHHHNHHHHHHHRHHHHHHKKHKHEKVKAQSVDQNQLLFSSDANNLGDTLKMSSSLSGDGCYPSSRETEKDTTVKMHSDFNKLSRKEQNKSSDDITQFLSTIKVTSDSIVDIGESSVKEHNAGPQLWSWHGKSFRRPGSKRKARKEYYKAIVRGKDILKVGDCAVFVSSGRPHLPYVGQIETMWQSWGGSMVVKVKWFYHPEEMKQSVDLSLTKGALFQSTHVDENDVQTISHKCELLTKQEYKRRTDLIRNTQYKMDYEDIYYLAGSYDPINGTVMLE